MRIPVIAGAVVVLGLGGCAFEQPLTPCVMGRGGHAVRYELKSATSQACARPKRAETVGVQKYNPPGQEQRVALQPDTLYQYAGDNAANQPISIGRLVSDFPDGEGQCRVENMSEGRVAAGSGGPPDTEIRYAWKDVRFPVSAAIPGTQWLATLEYTEGSCTATYEAVGVFPSITCRARNSLGDPLNNPDGTPKLDPELCKQADPFLLYALDPGFPVVCDPVSELCVLDGRPPAYKP